MISSVIHAAEAIADLRRWRDTLRARVRDSFAESAQALLAMVQAKLSGEVLQLRTGALRCEDDLLPTANVRSFAGGR